MLKALEDPDWREAFGYAGEPDTCATSYQHGVDIRAALPTSTVSLAPFTREDVADIVAMSEGENDGPPWVIYGRLHDGRWFYLEAGCDYTGWACHAGGSATMATSREECERFALTDDARARFAALGGA